VGLAAMPWGKKPLPRGAQDSARGVGDGGFFAALVEVFSLDHRALALFRIAMGVSSFYDVWSRATDGLYAHYTDAGVFPRSVGLENYQNPSWINVYGLAGTETGVFFLFVLQSIAALCVVVGYRTRLSTFLLWIMVASIQNRNTFVSHSGDELQRVALFFSIFLPLGECFSVDIVLDSMGKGRGPKSFGRGLPLPDVTPGDTFQDFSGATRLLSRKWVMQQTVAGAGSSRYAATSGAVVAAIGQIMLMWFSAHYHKTGLEWHTDYTATALAMQQDFLRRGWADFLMDWHMTLKFLTWAVYEWQFWGVLIWFSPFFTQPLKALTAAGFIVKHTSFAFFFRLGLFNFMTVATVMILMPPMLWDLLVLFFVPNRVKQDASMTRVVVPSYKLTGCWSCDFVSRLVSLFAMLPGSPEPVISAMSAKVPGVTGDRLAPNHRVDASCTCGDGCGAWSLVHDGTYWLTVEVGRGDIVQRLVNWDALAAVCAASPVFWIFEPLVLRSRESLGAFSNMCSLSFHALWRKRDAVDGGDWTTVPTIRRPGKGDTNMAAGRSRLAYAVHIAFVVLRKALLELSALFCLWVVLRINLENIGKSEHAIVPAIPPHVRYVTAHVLRLEQRWSMFAPAPPDVYWWVDIPAKLDDNRTVELVQDMGLHTFQYTFVERTAAEVARPPRPPTHETAFWLDFKAHRWLKYFEHAFSANRPKYEASPVRLAFGRYLCREFNKRHEGPDRVRTFQINMEREKLNRTTWQRERIGRVNVYNHACY
jgi:hypothetical protein